MLCSFTFLQGFKVLCETITKLYKGHTYMTWITIDNVQRVVAPKAGKSVTVLVFCKLYHGDIHLHKVSRKYLGTVFKLQSGHKYITEITIFKVQRAITPKVD